MRKTFAALLTLIAAVTALCYAAGIDPHPQATFTPQVPGAARDDSRRVFLEHAEVLYKERNDSFMIVSGDVKFTKGPMIMTCDSAHYYAETESFDAFGNVKMEHGDTLFIFAD